MDVVLSVGGQVVVDDQGHLLDIDATGQEVGGDEDTRGAGPELPHDDVSLLLVHVSVHGGDREVSLVHLLCQPVDLEEENILVLLLKTILLILSRKYFSVCF